MEQHSAEWFAARLGKVTASRIADVVAKTKSGYGASRANYRAQLVVERLTGVAAESYTNAAMQHGTDTEPQARAAYEWLADRSVVEVGFIEHPTIAMSGCSPDGLVGSDGLVEIKCPSTATHIETLLSETIPDKYVKQMQWQMACAGRQWCDFVSFDPRVPDKMRTFIKRVPRDDVLLDELSLEVRHFLAEVADTLARLQAKYELELAA
jgi:putative phage-type endonuclease